jgi:glycosyltransferase involved in cell wall biosynthesis
MKVQKAHLSVAIITKNEEEKLPDALMSVSFADDIVVLDSGSTDRTVEIANNFGCRVFVEEWKEDGPQKNSAVTKCRYEWVLVIDADERIPDETKKEIIKIVNNHDSADAYSFSRKNFLHGKWIKHSDWWPDYTVRLFKKSMGEFHFLTHGKWLTKGVVKKAATPIEHFSFSNYSDMFNILNERTTITAKELFRAGRKATVTTPLLHGASVFLKTYILKRGFLDGFDGLVIALTTAGGSFLKYAKLLELQKDKINDNSP